MMNGMWKDKDASEFSVLISACCKLSIIIIVQSIEWITAVLSHVLNSSQITPFKDLKYFNDQCEINVFAIIFCLFPRKICFKPMVDIVLHYFIHRITNWSVLLLQILQFFLQQNIVLKSLRLLLISHGRCCWRCCCCGGRSRCCLLTGWRSPVWGGVIPILPINLIKIEASNLFQ